MQCACRGIGEAEEEGTGANKAFSRVASLSAMEDIEAVGSSAVSDVAAMDVSGC